MKLLRRFTRRTILSISVALFASVPVLMIIHSGAATRTASYELETGNTSVGASKVDDIDASSQSAVKFSSNVDSESWVDYGWQITKNNTGLARLAINRTSLPVFSGQVTAGMTISQKRITRSLDLTNVPNVTLDRVWLLPSDGSSRGIILGPNTVIKDSDIDGSAMPSSGERLGIYGNSPGNYMIEGVAITGMTVSAWLDGDGSGIGTMTDTYIGEMVSNGGAHMDGLTRRAGTAPLVVNRCRIDTSGSSVTGAFFSQNTWGGRIGGVLVKDTFLEGDGYVIGIHNTAGTSLGFENVRIRSTGWGPISVTGTVDYALWSNVRVYDSNRLPLADGAVLNHP